MPARTPAFILLGLASLMLALSGCGGDDKEVGDPEGELNLIAWEGYVEDGSNDPKVDWVTDFEQETGCQVTVKVGDTSDEMVELMQTGDYDGVSASGDATLRLIESGDVAPVDTDLVPNYENVFEALKDQPFNSLDGQMYGIPHGRGANVLMWNTSSVQPDPDSWNVVFDPAEASQYNGSVTAPNNPIYIADAALYLRAHNPGLGIDNIYELGQRQFNAATGLLKQQRENVGRYWSSATGEITDFSGGATVVGSTWQYQANALEAEGVDVKTTLPSEGATGWSDTWMISSDAQHPNCMYLWMNHIIDPRVNAQVAEYFGEAPSNARSCEVTANPAHCGIFHADDEAYFDQVEYWNTPSRDCGDNRGEVCKDYDDWVAAWNSLRS